MTTLEVDAIARETSSLAPGRTDVVDGRALPCRWVISVGRSNSIDDVERATEAVLERVEKLGAVSLALVPFGMADRRLSLAEAARAQVDAVATHAAGDSRLEKIIYAVRGEDQLEAFALGDVRPPD